MTGDDSGIMPLEHDVRWWWVRHAPVVDHGGKLYGQRDVPCDVSDARALKALAVALPPEAVWVTSHLSRARDTARAILSVGCAGESPRAHQDAPLSGRAESAPIIESDFAEQSFGDWTGLSWEEIAAHDSALHARFWNDPVGLPPPGGESFVAVIARVSAAIERLSAARCGDIVAVAHGGTIRAALALALALEPARAMAVRVDNLSLTRLDRVALGTLRGRGGVWRVVGVNRPPY